MNTRWSVATRTQVTPTLYHQVFKVKDLPTNVDLQTSHGIEMHKADDSLISDAAVKKIAWKKFYFEYGYNGHYNATVKKMYIWDQDVAIQYLGQTFEINIMSREPIEYLQLDTIAQTQAPTEPAVTVSLFGVNRELRL